MGGKEEFKVMRDVLNELVIDNNFINKPDRELLQEVRNRIDELVNKCLYKDDE